MLRTALLAALCATALPAAAQQPPAPIALPDETSGDDIIVSALRIPREKLPTGVYWNYQSILITRIVRENAEMFMRCALKPSNLDRVREVVDGEPNSATARFAQGWISETNRGCYPPVRTVGVIQSNGPASIADRGVSRVDRGVIVESVLRSYAPDAQLTPAMTEDTRVRSRFQQREGLRNRKRLPEDRDALVFASCLVRSQPVLATRLYRSEPGSLLERGLAQTIVVQGRACVGDASRVTIDPSLLRVYVMDAFYRWVVAARGVDSLIPANA